jgi:Ni/Fe-hydrogenase subunit HybB-like protein
MSTHVHPKPIGGDLLDRPMMILLGLFGVAVVVIGYRFFAGIGAVSNMNDGYTWGIWEPVNVVVFTGIGAGAYSVGLLCYLLNRGRYHPLVRPAVLLGAIAYSLGGASILVALGRYWNIYWLAMPGMWNLSSVLVEVAVCVIVYVCVLWIEVLPAVLDGAVERTRSAWARKAGARLAKVMPYIIALAMLLPTMHQSSLGGLMLVAGPKLHPLWHTPLLPLLALVSCLSMGFGAVVVLTAVMEHTWNAKGDQDLLADMAKVNGGLLMLFGALRLGDIAYHGKLRLLAVPDRHLAFFVLEMGLFLVPALMFLSYRVQRDRRLLGVGALLTIVAGAVWRIDTFLTCYDAGDGWSYVPSFGEISVTVGMAAIGVAVFVVVSKLLPVVAVEDRARPGAAGRGASSGG